MQCSEFPIALKWILTFTILEEQKKIHSLAEDHFSCYVLQTKKNKYLQLKVKKKAKTKK